MDAISNHNRLANKRLISFILCAVAVLALHLNAYAQSKFPFKLILKEVGVWGGFGYGIDNNSLPEGNYSPRNFSAQFTCKGSFLKNDSVRGKEDFFLFFEPMYNVVVIKSPKGNLQEWDGGITTGLKYNYRLLPSLVLSFQVGSGPHWFSATTSRQAPGFLFSNQVGFALYQELSEKVSVSFMFRIRHMSNADTRQPNHGINTNNYLWGLSYRL